MSLACSLGNWISFLDVTGLRPSFIDSISTLAVNLQKTENFMIVRTHQWYFGVNWKDVCMLWLPQHCILLPSCLDHSCSIYLLFRWPSRYFHGRKPRTKIHRLLPTYSLSITCVHGSSRIRQNVGVRLRHRNYQRRHAFPWRRIRAHNHTKYTYLLDDCTIETNERWKKRSRTDRVYNHWHLQAALCTGG